MPERGPKDIGDILYERKLKRIAATAEVIYAGLGVAAGDGAYVAIDHGAPFVAAATALLGATLFTGALLFDSFRRKESTKESFTTLFERHKKGKHRA